MINVHDGVLFGTSEQFIGRCQVWTTRPKVKLYWKLHYLKSNNVEQTGEPFKQKVNV